MEQTGIFIRDLILGFAALLKDPSVPGLVVLFLFGLCALAICGLWLDMQARAIALRHFSAKVETVDKADFAGTQFDEFSGWINEGLKGSKRAADPLREAWDEFVETMVIDERDGKAFRRNTVRPTQFFNIEDLGYGPGFYRILPGIFVSLGLALTFLGLIGALSEMAAAGEINDATMLDLIRIASAKFIMSLSGLACSIILTLALRFLVGRVEKKLHRLVRELEKRVQFVSLEGIAMAQLRVLTGAEAANKKIALEMVADLGRPLREQLPQAISASINESLKPILDQVSRQGTDSMSNMASDLSKQVTDGMGEALNAASASMAQAGDRIAKLADRMDGSSGRMGVEMESAVARMAKAVDNLSDAMTKTATDTGGVFAQGAEQILAAMNDTLKGIRENTGEGARAMSAAAEEMTKAARTMKEEMEGAARAGSEAARGRMETAGEEVGSAIAGAGKSLAGTYEEAAGRIAELAKSLSDQTGQDLLAPLKDIEGRLKGMVTTLDDGVRKMQGFASAVGEGAQAGTAAADSFRSASKDLVNAVAPIRGTVERIETSTRSLNESVTTASATVIRSSQQVALAAKDTLEAAGKTIGDEQRSIAAVVGSIETLVREMKGQGDRIDDIDRKLGHAFELYTDKTASSMQSIRTHVTEMAEELNAALDALRAIVDSLQAFEPQQIGTTR